MELSRVDLQKLKYDTLLQLASVKGVDSSPGRPKKKDLISNLLSLAKKRSREPEDEPAEPAAKRARVVEPGSASPASERSAVSFCATCSRSDGRSPFTTPSKRKFEWRSPTATPLFGFPPTPPGPSLTPARALMASMVDAPFGFGTAKMLFANQAADQDSELLRLPAVVLAQVLAWLGFRDKVGLWRVKALQSFLLTRTAWEPLVIDSEESYHFCMNFYARPNLSTGLRGILRTMQECRSLRMDLWNRPPYERPLTDDEPSDRDDPGETERKRTRRTRREQNNAANFAHGALLFHVLRFRQLRSLHLTNVHAEYGPRLVKDVRKGFKHLGYFRVLWDQPQGAYAVIAEDREPEPLHPEALLADNAVRHGAMQAAIQQRANGGAVIGFHRNWGHRPTEPLSHKEALFLQEFAVVAKVLSQSMDRADAKEKVAFTFGYGASLRSVRKGEARELYGSVLETLRAKYPKWAACIPDQPAALRASDSQ